MFCKNCGKELREGAVFCANCGAKVVSQTDTAKTAAEMQVDITQAAVETQAVKKEVKQETEKLSPVPAKMKNKKKGKGGIIARAVILVLLIVAVLGVGLYFTSDSYKLKKSIKLADVSYENGEYADALEYYDMALDIDASMVEVYVRMAQIYIAQEEYDDAIYILEKAISECEDTDENNTVFKEKKIEAYLNKTDSYVTSGDYTKAYDTLNEGIADTGAKVLSDKKSEVYISESDSYLAAGDCEMAVRILIKGEEDTGAKILTEREEYIRKSIIVVKKIIYNVNGNIDYINEYDDNEKLIKKTYYKKDGNTDSWCEYEYDTNEKLTKLTNYDDKGKISGWSEYMYDNNEKPSKSISYNSDGRTSGWYEYEYDSNRNLIKEVHYNISNTFIGWFEYEYDAIGNRTKEVHYSSKGKISGWYEYEYDANGNQTKEIDYKSDGSIDSWYEYEFDIFCNPIITKYSNGKCVNTEYTYKYISH